MNLPKMPPPPAGQRGAVHKFGGSSMANADLVRGVADIMAARKEAPQVCVVSAMSGVTDALIHLAMAASREDPAWRETLETLRQRHLETAKTLNVDKATLTWLDQAFSDLADILRSFTLLGASSTEGLAYVQGLGEVFSSRILAAHLASRGIAVDWLDARDVLVIRHGDLGASVEWETSSEKLKAWRAAHTAPRIVATGYVARDENGAVTTLGRNGSDYSASIFGALFDVAEIHIWTDVNGVLSADPNRAPEAIELERLSYAEACEMAYFGAKVIHPQTMFPAMARGIPLRIRNTFQPAHEGTLISAEPAPYPPVKGVSTIGGLALVEVAGAGLMGVPGTAERVFAALHRASISVVMISQGSSEHSICCVVAAKEAPRALAILRDAFAPELARGQVRAVQADARIAVLAAVGDGMAGTPGIAARMFEALARAAVNIRAIAQGSSERNISVAIDEAQATRALRAVHAAFHLSPQTMSIGIVGPGRVGAALVQQIAATQARLKTERGLDLRVRAIANSRKMLLNDRSVDLNAWESDIEKGVASDLDAFTEHLTAPHLPHAIIIDCSASSATADRYAGWLERGIHVITPNKQAGGGDRARYAAVRKASEAGGRFRYEATVGAGLPVITTLRDLIDTGDDVLAVDGILSGTLAWLFNRYDGSKPFSELVREAHELGYTEPDPREDLSGLDVARKLVILAREIGHDVALDDVKVEGLAGEALQKVTRDQFMERLSELDAPMEARLKKARAEGKVLRYVAHLDAEGLSVGLVDLPKTHAFGNLRETDNIVQFTTRRYHNNPLVVQGPGAGPDVTAGGVFADLLRVAAGIGARV